MHFKEKKLISPDRSRELYFIKGSRNIKAPYVEDIIILYNNAYKAPYFNDAFQRNALFSAHEKQFYDGSNELKIVLDTYNPVNINNRVFNSRVGRRVEYSSRSGQKTILNSYFMMDSDLVPQLIRDIQRIEDLPEFIDVEATFIAFLDQVKSKNFSAPRLISPK
ncbi:MAG: hypothetical protein M1409_01625 [Actinobacteria bacterium]|nr:hypothetical protein [Actinomycetota bacterium]